MPPPSPTDLTDALLQEASWVRALAARLAKDQAVADDVTQEALVLALERQPAVRASLRPWLARVAARLVRRAQRSDRRRSDHERASALERTKSVEDDRLLERLELQERLARRVRELPEPYRGLILRRYYEGRSAPDIARETGSSAATVRSQIARGLERLRRDFARDGSDERPESMHATLLALLVAAGTNPPNLTQGTLIVKTSTKVAVALCVVGLLGVGGATWITRDARSQTADSSTVTYEPVEASAAPALASVEESSTRDEAGLASPASPTPASERTADSPTEAAPEAVTTLVARLVDEGGAPLLGAELRSVLISGEPRGETCFGIADAGGRATVDMPDRFVRHWRTQVYEMTFRASAPMRATKFVVSSPEWHATTDVGDVVLPRGGALRGRVTDIVGAGVEGAAVYLARGAVVGPVDALRLAGPDKTVRRPRATSRTDGSFEFPGAATGGWRVVVGLEGMLWSVSDEVFVQADSWTDAGTLVLEPLPQDEIIAGIVIRPDGEPAPGARVSYETAETHEDGVLTADDEGRFTFAPGGPQVVDFVARDPDGDFTMSVMARAARGARDLRLELMPKRTLALLVLDDDTGEPIEGASAMTLRADGHQYAGGGTMIVGERWSRSEGDGRIDLDIPPVSVRVPVSCTGYQSAGLGPWAPPQVPGELTVRLTPQPTVEGRVVAYGEPIAGAKVQAVKSLGSFMPVEAGFPLRFMRNESRAVTSDADGRFACPLDPEWTDVVVLASAPGWARAETQLAVTAGEGADGVEVALSNGGVVTGHVTPPEGYAQKGLVVVGSCGDGALLVTRTDERGDYRFEGVMPGPWRVVPMLAEPSRDIVSIARSEEDRDFKWNVEVVDGGTSTLDLDARGLLGAQVHGTLSIDGAPAAGFTAAVLPDRLERYTNDRPAVELDDSGNFVLSVPSGRRSISLAGTLSSGHRIEIVREIVVEGTRVDWSEDLPLGQVDEVVKPEEGALRLRGGSVMDWGDRVTVHVEADADGKVQAPSPTGEVNLQRQIVVEFGAVWKTVAKVDVAPD